ncbi:DUF4149 domain-containing protein [Spirulina subsalsa]|uniref:DUF4149 domain-containing protein n=1 Tax=Spirulina subsalsa TaxID=54311 RepID=UPI0002DA9D6D|nr:DUF4149 domain-containing protein [Spirulina subsalsa]
MASYSNQWSKPLNWQLVVLATLGFWLSSSVVIDFVILPSLYASGMMAQEGFIGAGYLVFGIFNRLELLCAGLITTCFLVLHFYHHHLSKLIDRGSLILSGVLLTIALIYTYILTPQMSGFGLHLNLFDSGVSSLSNTMVAMQFGYWGLELAKLVIGAVLVRWCYREMRESLS